MCEVIFYYANVSLKNGGTKKANGWKIVTDSNELSD